MAFKKTLAQRLLSITKISPQSLSNCRISSSSVSVQSRIPPTAAKRDIAPDPGDDGIFRRFLHRRAVFQPELRPPAATNNNLLQKLREMDIARSRIRLEGLSPPETEEATTVEDVRKLLRAAQLETVKSKLRKVPQDCITYSEFIQMCAENCSDHDQAKRIAKMLDDSATVIIIGDVVFLRPEQVNFYFSTIFFFKHIYLSQFVFCFIVVLGCVLICGMIQSGSWWRIRSRDRFLTFYRSSSSPYFFFNF